MVQLIRAEIRVGVRVRLGGLGQRKNGIDTYVSPVSTALESQRNGDPAVVDVCCCSKSLSRQKWLRVRSEWPWSGALSVMLGAQPGLTCCAPLPLQDITATPILILETHS